VPRPETVSGSENDSCGFLIGMERTIDLFYLKIVGEVKLLVLSFTWMATLFSKWFVSQ
jgi:hypothetical protein